MSWNGALGTIANETLKRYGSDPSEGDAIIRGGDTALVVAQLETDQRRGAIVVARVLVASVPLLGRATLPFARNEFLSA